ncbi:hypothetical protein Clacol_009728 [Clathrus columnatus]|uniref:Uncharacterized protein n=1 Tax=Clathrus columnatus TaxID=1419009 RepID=A0AAV5ALY5_9AGAM|nr:hypothetical protein Clacol_009728 [Clathrus columnatus]
MQYIASGQTISIASSSNIGLTRHKPSLTQIHEAQINSASQWSMEESDHWDVYPATRPVHGNSASVPPPPARVYPAVSDFPALPKPEPHSGQRAGESWRQFLDRCQIIVTEKLKKEIQQQQQRHKSLLKVLDRGPVKSSTVYTWQKDDDTNFRIHTRIFKASSYDTWKSYHPDQHHFDPVFNEWDLCSEFGDPTENHEMAPDSDDNDDNLQYGVPLQTPGPAPSEARRKQILELNQTSRHILEEDVNDVYGSNEIKTTLSIPLIYFEHALEKCYGFSPPFSLNSPTPEPVLGQLNVLSDKQWTVLCKRYMQQPQQTNIPSYTRSLIECFTTSIASLNLVDHKPPSHHIWDIQSSHSKSIHPKMLMSPVGIQPIKIDDQTLYELKLNDQPLHLNVECHLLVSDAVTALQCIHEGWGPTLKDIAISLVSISVNFHIFKTPPTPRPCVPIVLHPPVLGYRNQNYTPTTGDYLKYVEIRNAVLKNLVVALLLLEEEFFDPSSVVNLDFSQNEHIVHYPTPSDECWETTLTEADEDILCRVYYIYTGKGKQTTQVSWWPKQNVWARKGLSTGYWTAQCEEWYQFGLKTILEGKAHLRNSTDWANSLSFQKQQTSEMIQNHEKAATMLLDSQYFP